jgi:hypothetical protein
MSVKDNFYTYFDNLTTELTATYKTLKSGTVYKPTPPSFPYMYIKQIGGSTALTTLSGTENGVDLGIQIDFYSKVSAQDVRKIANTARNTMISYGFTCNYFEPIENTGDTSIYRFVARFEKLET